MYQSYLERKNDQVLTFYIVHSPNFEISAFLQAVLLSNKHCTLQFQNLISNKAS